jgi:hypothetical protein
MPSKRPQLNVRMSEDTQADLNWLLSYLHSSLPEGMAGTISATDVVRLALSELRKKYEAKKRT